MNITNIVQNFLILKFDNKNIKKKDFVLKSGISYPTLYRIMHLTGPKLDFKTILKIANYFNCSVDEVLGRVLYKQNQTFNPIEIVLSSYNSNLRCFIKNKIREQNLDLCTLSKELGFYDTSILKFVHTTSDNRTLSSPIILAIANFFKTSIDLMIGRVK